MKHLDYIEDMYIKNKLTQLSDSDIKKYHNKFTSPRLYNASGNKDRLAKADFMFRYSGPVPKKQLFQHIRDMLFMHNLIISKVVIISIPLFYITFDGTFSVKLKKLIDDHITPVNKKETEFSYFILFDRSDLFIQATVYTTDEDSFSGLRTSECLKRLDEMEKKIKEGYFRGIPFKTQELKDRVSFWKSLGYSDAYVTFNDVGSGLGLDLPGTQAYPAYLEKKKGFFPSYDEDTELQINHYNKLLPLIVTALYECRERLYKDETLEDVYNVYIGLGFVQFRYIGGHLFKIDDLENYNDMILNKTSWVYLEKVKYYDYFYYQYLNLKDCMYHFLKYRKRNIRRVLESPLDFDDIDKLSAVVEFNILTDPTMDVRPKYRHPVTYDYFTTPRITHSYKSNIASVKEEDLSLCVPVLELTEDVKSLIDEYAPRWGYRLTEDAAEDEYFTFREFDLKVSKEQLQKDLKDPEYLAAQEGNLTKSIKLMHARMERNEKLGLVPKVPDYNSWGVRKHLKLSEDANFR